MRSAHTIPGRIALNEGMEEMALSLMGQPVFFDAKQGKVISNYVNHALVGFTYSRRRKHKT